MRESNEPVAIKPLRVLAATLILFLLSNLCFALANPSTGHLALFNDMLPGFDRFPELRAQADASGVSIMTDFDILFPLHIISSREKPKDEFRIVMVGDSSVWGTLLRLEQTMTGQINSAQLQSCDNRRVVAYNLGLGGKSALRDLLMISELVNNDQPDLIIWSFTMNTFSEADKSNEVFANANYGRTRALEEITGYHFLDDTTPPRESSWVDRTIYGRREELNLLYQLSWLRLKSLSIGTDDFKVLDEDDRVQDRKVGKKDDYEGLRAGDNALALLDARFLLSAVKIAKGVPIIYLNEPMYTITDNPVRYNASYPHWAYDQYRSRLGDLSREYSWTYLDLWDLVPPSEFSNSLEHRTVEGETLVTRELIPAIISEACPQ